MNRTIWPSGFLLATLLAGCGSESMSPAESLSTLVTPREQWCGGLVQVQATRYRLSTPRFSVDSQLLETRRVDGETYEVRLPLSTCGTLTISESSRKGHVTDFVVETRGFVERYVIRPGLIGGMVRWPRDGQASVIGSTGDGVGRVLPVARSMTDIPVVHVWTSWSWMRSVGLSYDPNRVLLLDSAYQVRPWYLLPTPAPASPDSAPFVHPWYAMEMAPGSWLGSDHHYAYSLGSSGSTEERVEETQGMVLSPNGRLATIRVNTAWDGIPVWDAQTGLIAYRVQPVRAAYGVDFSPNSRYLYFAGRDQSSRSPVDPGIIAGVDAATGSLLFMEALGNYVAGPMLADPNAPILYVTAEERDSNPAPGAPTILVHNAVTGARIATLTILEEDACPDGCEWISGGILVHDPFVDELFFVIGGKVLEETIVFRYTLPKNRDELLGATAASWAH